jgi:SnoaL-like domain
MRYRLREWDVAMPEALVSYWAAWNERDTEQIAGHLVSAVVADVEWNDPRDSFVGIDELGRAVERLRTTKPDYRFAIMSELDHHHDRFRYRWVMFRGARTLMEGIDIVTVDPTSGLIMRVDGFFGNPTLIRGNGESGVPLKLQRGEDVVE